MYTYLEAIDSVGHILMAGRSLVAEDDRLIDGSHEGVATICQLGGVTHYHLQTVNLRERARGRGINALSLSYHYHLQTVNLRERARGRGINALSLSYHSHI